MPLRVLIACGLLALSVAGCVRYPPEIYGFATEPTYALEADDEIRIVIYEVDNVPQLFRVDAGGRISHSLVGIVPVRGLTVRQLEHEISERLRRRNIVRNPMVAVEVVRYRPIYVLGEVRSAGRQVFTPGMTVEAAVATAGGYTERAQMAEARLVRPGPEGSTVVSYVPGGYPVRPGDAIYIPERFF
jgi:polysaccharide export outer membrane protein